MRRRGRRQNWNVRGGREINFRALRRLDSSQYLLLSAESGLSIVGSAPKDLLIYGTAEEWHAAHIAKGPRILRAKECVTEEIISAVGRTLPVKLAESQVVLLGRTKNGDKDIRFLSKYFLKRGEEQLVHGVELVAAYLQADSQEVAEAFASSGTAEQSLYTVEALLEVLADACRHGELKSLRDGFGRMLAFDAIVGANDRHAMNWGVVRQALRDAPLRYAPIFDTARGLFWDHEDAKFREVDGRGEREQYIHRYAEKSKPLIGCAAVSGARQVNHFEVIEAVLTKFPNEFRSSIPPVIRAFDPERVSRMLYRRFGRVVSRERLEYIDLLLRLRHKRLAASLR